MKRQREGSKMTRSILGLASFVGLLCVGAGEGRAQPPAPGVPRPTFSPYLNLARPGTNPAINYYGLVRPEMQFRQSILNLQSSVAANQQSLGALEAEREALRGTGHSIQFMNYGGYFMNYGPSAGTTGFLKYGLSSGTVGGGTSARPGAQGSPAAAGSRGYRR
jgi:hypothetical protein